MMIKEMRSEDKPRERFAKAPDTASMVDLVAILLRTGRHGCSVMDMAQEVVEQIRLSTDVNGFDNLDWRDLISVKGVGQDKAIAVCAAVELGRRMAQFHNKKQLENFSFPEAVASYFMEKLRHEDQEHFIVCFLNTKNRLLGYKEICVGSLDAAPVDIKEAMRWALRFKAHGMILVHNHPSGYPEPSDADINLTRQFRRATSFFDIRLLDHVIIGDGEFASLNKNGLV